MSDCSTNFFKVSNDIIENDVLSGISDSAFRLLIYLKQKEGRYGKRNQNGDLYFWRTDEQIAKDLKKNIKTIKKAKKELIDKGIIITRLIPYDAEGGGYTKKHVTVYFIRC